MAHRRHTLFFLLIFTLQGLSQPLITLENENVHSLDGKFEYLLDEGKSLTVDQVSRSGGWQKAEGKTLNLGYTGANVWIRFSALANRNVAEWLLEVGYPPLDSVDLYAKEDTAWTGVYSGEMYPLEERSLQIRTYAFELNLIPGQEKEFYLRVFSEGGVQIPLVLTKKDTLFTSMTRQNYILGIYYGFIIVMMLYNLFVYFSVRENAYLHYIFFIGSVAAFQMNFNGFAGMFLWGTGWWLNASAPFFIGTCGLFITFFMRSFLKTEENAPVIHRISWFMSAVNFMIIICVFVFPYSVVAKMIAYDILVTVTLAIWAGARCLLKGFRAARFYMIAWLGAMLGGAVYVLKQLGVMPSNFFTEYSIQFGSGAEVILISLALADRINILKREKTEAQEKALAMLEQKVAERTAEVTQQKAIIEAKSKDILDSIKYARRLQEAILPPESFFRQLFSDSFVFYRPKDIVSGDFYWFEQKGEKKYFAAVDCTGHGVPGAFMSIVGYNLLNQAVNEKGILRPSEILDFMRLGVNYTLRQKQDESSLRDGMDIALCCYDASKGVLEFAGANNSLYRLRDGKLEILKADKQPVGAFVEEHSHPFTCKTLEVKKGDSFYVFTDGIADQFGGPAGKKFKYSRLRAFVTEKGSLPMDHLKNELENTFYSWKGNNDQVDDVCVIGIRI